MIEHLLTDTIKKVSHTINEYGDYVYGAETDLACRFREINALNVGDHKELLNSDAIVHLLADSGVKLGDILEYGGAQYKIDEIVQARKVGPNVEFIKCGLSKQRQVS